MTMVAHDDITNIIMPSVSPLSIRKPQKWNKNIFRMCFCGYYYYSYTRI